MTKDDIIILPNPHLRQKSKRVTAADETIKKLIKDMQDATLDWEDSRPHEVGVALAAVQVDKLYRVVVIRDDFDNKDDRNFHALINPEIIKGEGELVTDYEGCLSVKDVYGLVPRYPKIRLKALDIDGREVRLRASGFLARVLQHEIDHTNGIMFIDHIKDKDAFFHLNDDGELTKVPHEHIENSDILW